MKNKIWLAGQVGGNGEFENIKKLLSFKDYFEGVCFCVNYQKEDFSDDDGTYKLLLENKKNGRILRSNWVNINSLGMTMAIQSGPIKFGDWVFLLDSQEEPKKEFLDSLQENIVQWEAKGYEAASWGRPYLFKFYPDMTFQPTSVHTMVHPIRTNSVDLRDESKVVYDEKGVHFANFIYNKKKFPNSMLLHGVKYCLWNVSNQMNMFYSNPEEFQEHENQRIRFTLYLDKLGFERSLDGLAKFIRSEYFVNVIDYFEWEFVFKDFYRYSLLNHNLNDIINTRKTWSLKEYLTK
jgi:hypothetical protein